MRERREDIPGLVHHAIGKLNLRFGRNIEGLTGGAMAILFRYTWPGNVRELLNLLEAVYVNLPSRTNSYIDLPRQIQNQLNMEKKQSKAERNIILSTLLETNWNKSTAAQKLKWSRMTLYRKIAKYHIVENRNPPR